MAFHSCDVEPAPRMPLDVVERQPGVLEHADEDEQAERARPVPALARPPLVGHQQAAALVVAHRGRGHAGPPGQPRRSVIRSSSASPWRQLT